MKNQQLLNHHEGYSYGLPGSNGLDGSSSSQIQDPSQNAVATAVKTSQDQIDSAGATAKGMGSIEPEKELSDTVNQEKPSINPVDGDKDAASKYLNCTNGIAAMVGEILSEQIDSTMKEKFIKKYCASEKDS
uniref:Uncharacterized protein n=1 Tax=Tetranychus urticae TaxID=32264 RepID=T1L4W7_TETUR